MKPRLKMAIACLLLIAVNGGVTRADENEKERPPVVLTDAAKRIHSECILIDGHNDLPYSVRARAGSSFTRCDIAKDQPKMHTDIPRLREGGLKAQFWSVYVPASTDRTGNALLQTLEQIDLVHEMVERYPQHFEMASTADDIERIVADGKIASMIGVEGGHSIQGSLQVLHKLYERGARYMTLTHSKTLAWADSATDQGKNGGLSPFGEEVVREMNRIGMLVDLSHVSEQTMEDAFRIVKAPVIYSHSSARAINNHPRNVSDAMLRRTKKNGGVVMINFYSGYVVPTEKYRENRRLRGTVHDVVDHIEHVINVAGVDHVGIGSDYDGVGSVPKQLDDVSFYPYITQELLNRGHSEADIKKIMGGNLLRAMRGAEQVARRLRSGEIKFEIPSSQPVQLGTVAVEAKEDRVHSVVSASLKRNDEELATEQDVALVDGEGNVQYGSLYTYRDSNQKMQNGVLWVEPSLNAGDSVKYTVRELKASEIEPNFQWKIDGALATELQFNKMPVVRYMYEKLDESTPERRGETYKVFHHVYSPDGKTRLTKGPGGLFPHHRGLFYGFNRIRYGDKHADIWHCPKGEFQSHKRFTSIHIGHVKSHHEVQIDWHGRDREVFATEFRKITAYDTKGGRLLEIDSTLKSQIDEAIVLDGDPQHAGFQFRATQHVPDKTKDQTYYIRPDGKDQPGSFRNWSAKENETEVNKNHVDLPWLALSMVVDGKRYTVCYLVHPDNPKPHRFSERDYGRFGAYFVYRLTKDNPLRIRYRYWIQEGEMTVEEIQKLSRDFVNPISPK